MVIYFAAIAPRAPLAWDLQAYYEAGAAVMAGEPFIGLQPEIGGGEYVYPPIVVLGFVPYGLFSSWEIPFAIHALVNLSLLGALAWVTLRELEYLGVPIARADRVLIVAFCVASLYPLMNLGLGQVDPFITLLITMVFIGVERRRDHLAGTALAIAGIIKLFPIAIGIWLLYQRRWRAIATAFLVGVLAILVSLFVFGLQTNQAYVELILFERSRLQAFAEGLSPDFFSISLIRPISTLMQGLPPITFLIVSVALVAPILWFIYQRTTTRVDRHVAYLATLIAVIIALPSSNFNHLLYLYFPLIVLFYSLRPGRTRRLLLTGMVVMLIPIQPGIITATLESLALSAEFVELVSAVTNDVLSFASIALIGTIILLGACVHHANQTAQTDRTFRKVD